MSPVAWEMSGVLPFDFSRARTEVERRVWGRPLCRPTRPWGPGCSCRSRTTTRRWSGSRPGSRGWSSVSLEWDKVIQWEVAVWSQKVLFKRKWQCWAKKCFSRERRRWQCWARQCFLRESGFSPLINFVHMLNCKNYDCSHNCNQWCNDCLFGLRSQKQTNNQNCFGFEVNLSTCPSPECNDKQICFAS